MRSEFSEGRVSSTEVAGLRTPGTRAEDGRRRATSFLFPSETTDALPIKKVFLRPEQGPFWVVHMGWAKKGL